MSTFFGPEAATPKQMEVIAPMPLVKEAFGKSRQTIALSVAPEIIQDVVNDLGPNAKIESAADGKVIWTRWSTRRRDDEDIVWELSMLLSRRHGASWSIDWRMSDY